MRWVASAVLGLLVMGFREGNVVDAAPATKDQPKNGGDLTAAELIEWEDVTANVFSAEKNETVRNIREGSEPERIDDKDMRETKEEEEDAAELKRIAKKSPLELYQEMVKDGSRHIFKAESLPNKVMLFGHHLHYKLNFITTHFGQKDQRCTHGGQKWKNISTAKKETGFEFACVFGPDADSFETETLSVTEQVVGCKHPATKELRTKALGHSIRFKVTYGFSSRSIATPSYVPSTAVYTGQPAPSPPPPKKKKYYFCACITMWYRSEFLLEWARYHQLVHGFEKIFVYDNDSEVDQLEDVSRVINASLPIEHVNWPYKKVQPAYMGHCLLKSRPECTWTSFFDVDEFAYAKQSDGRLDSILRMTEENFPTIGALEVQMASMVPSENTPLHQLMRKPDHGVVRNYVCRYKSTNIKTIAKTDTVMESLYSGVHFFCYKPGFIKKTLKSYSNPVLFHYTTQSWEVMMRKHVRRASPASKPFYGKVSLDEPSQKWAKQATESCRSEDMTMHDHTLCTLTYKDVPNCAAPAKQKLLVVGTGGVGSGLTWLERELCRTLHEVDPEGKVCETQVRVDWKLAILSPPEMSSKDPLVSLRFSKIFHIVREPLKAISSIMSYTAEDWAAVKKASKFDAAHFTNDVVRALHHWVHWNHLAELGTDARYRAEDVSLAELCADSGLSDKCMPESKGNDLLSPRTFPRLSSSPDLTWDQLNKLDMGVAKLARGMARRYGYAVPWDKPHADYIVVDDFEKHAHGTMEATT